MLMIIVCLVTHIALVTDFLVRCIHNQTTWVEKCKSNGEMEQRIFILSRPINTFPSNLKNHLVYSYCGSCRPLF